VCFVSAPSTHSPYRKGAPPASPEVRSSGLPDRPLLIPGLRCHALQARLGALLFLEPNAKSDWPGAMAAFQPTDPTVIRAPAGATVPFQSPASAAWPSSTTAVQVTGDALPFCSVTLAQ